MAIEQKRSVGSASASSITSIAPESNQECILNEICETTGDVPDVPLKVRKPYTISKQRERWTEEEHQKFIDALKLYGRAWRQIEEYIGTKTAVQIRSHAQKFFSKVMKEGACSVEASTEPILIPPPRPKRKPLHPYPRKLVETPSVTKHSPTLVENGTSTNVKTSDREVHSPISVLSTEGSHISTSYAKAQGSGSASRTSSGSNLSQAVEKNTLMKDSSSPGKEKENVEDLSLTPHSGGPSLTDSTLMSGGKTLKDVKSTTNEDNYSDYSMKCVGGGTPIKIIKLFGRTVAVPDQSENSDGMNDVVIHTATCNGFTELASKTNSQSTSGNILICRGPSDKGSKSFSCTGSNTNSFNEVRKGAANLDSVDSKLDYTQQANANSDKLKKGFYPYKRCSSDRVAVYTSEDRESQRIRVYL